jgi:hypothetical protein
VTWNVDDKELESVFALGAAERYRYFVARAARYGEVWSLRDDNGWATAEDDSGGSLFPVWPHRRYAETCAVGDWEGLAPRSIDVDEWVTAWTPKTKKDGLKIVVFPTPDETGVIAEPDQVAGDLDKELEQFE